MNARVILAIAGVLGLLSVIAGAAGAHVMSGLSDKQAHWYETALRYHQFHALALLAIGIVVQLMPAVTLYRWAATMMLVGLTLFSGTLYVMALTGANALGKLTPLGGLSLMAGWLLFVIATVRGR